MTAKANGTEAKDIAIHFVEETTGRATPQIMKKSIIQAKILLESGYTKEEIIDVIDFIVSKKSIEMYSLGYVNACINDVLSEIKKHKSSEIEREKSKEVRKEIESIQECQRNEVADDVESTKRNREKINRLGTESRFGEKFNFDMFEGN